MPRAVATGGMHCVAVCYGATMSPQPTQTQTFQLTYEQLGDGLSAIGGIDGLLVMLPALLPDVEEALLERIE